MNTLRSFFRRSRRAVLLLVALAWSSFAFCDQIHDAARDGDLEKVKSLLQTNPKLVSSKDQDGRTPLHWAAASGRKEMVELLLANKANVHAKDNGGETPYDLASAHKDVAELLRQNGGKKTTTSHDLAIFKAATDGDLVKVKALVEDDPDEAFNKIPDGYPSSALDCAAAWGRKDVVEYLLDHKADIEDKNVQCQTPLMDAAYGGHADVVKLLLDRGAKVNAVATIAVDKDAAHGDTALHFAAQNDHKDAVDVLLAGKADPNAKNANGWTPLYWAAQNGCMDVAQSLLAGGADVNAKDNFDQTPLHIAASKGRTEIAALLLAKGADVNARDKKGHTPVHDAMDGGVKDKAVAELLGKHGGAY